MIVLSSHSVACIKSLANNKTKKSVAFNGGNLRHLSCEIGFIFYADYSFVLRIIPKIDDRVFLSQ